MSNALQVFAYEDKTVRTVQRDGETWWVLKDVCDALELSNPTIVAERLDVDERAKLDLSLCGKSSAATRYGGGRGTFCRRRKNNSGGQHDKL